MAALVAALLCVLANAFFVAAEFALAKVRPTTLEALAKRGDRSAQRAFDLTKHLDAYLSATQLGITLASLGLGALGEPALAHLIEPPLRWLGAPPVVIHGVALAFAFTVISLLHIVIGELVPKSVALARPADVARHTARALRIFYFAMWPFLWFLNGASRRTLRLLRLPAPDHAEGSLSLDELRLLIAASHEGGSLGERERTMMERVIRGADRPVRSIMIPRVDMTVLSMQLGFDACLAQIRKHGYSRYPLSASGEADDIVGYLYVKDLLGVPRPKQDNIHSFKRDVLFIPESTTVGDLMSSFQRSKIPVAIVVDEYGGTSGLVTLEDAVEEIVGEIQDELDVESPRVSTLDDGTWLVDGAVPLSEIKLEGFELHTEEDGDLTIAAYLVREFGRLARPGDVLEVGAYEVVVDDVRQRRVSRVRVRKHSPASMLPERAYSSSPGTSASPSVPPGKPHD